MYHTLVIHGQLWTIHVYLMHYCCVATPLLTCIQLITFTNMVVGTAYNYNCFNVMNSFTNFNFDFHFVLACFGGNLIIGCMLMHFFRGNTLHNKCKNCDNYNVTKHFVFKIMNICYVNMYIHWK